MCLSCSNHLLSLSPLPFGLIGSPYKRKRERERERNIEKREMGASFYLALSLSLSLGATSWFSLVPLCLSYLHTLSWSHHFSERFLSLSLFNRLRQVDGELLLLLLLLRLRRRRRHRRLEPFQDSVSSERNDRLVTLVTRFRLSK